MLDALLKRIYTPGDPLYRHYLKAGRFAESFGPTQADYEAVIAFAKKNGLRVTATHANRALLDVAGSSEMIEKTFGVHMMSYRTARGRSFHAPDSEPSIPASLAPLIVGIVGLDNALEAGSNVTRLPSAPLQANVAPNGGPGIVGGTGPLGGLSPSDISNAYNLNGLAQTGSGQTIALFELDGYYASDITAYEDQFGLPHVTVQNVLVNGFNGTPTAPTLTTPDPTSVLEVTLDIELAIAMAPGATKILVYEGNSFTDVYSQIANDDLAQQVSTSWYPQAIDSNVSPSMLQAEFTSFKQMAMQGQSFYAASGDYGDKVRVGTDISGNPILQFGVQDPSSQPYCTGVGGTLLFTNEAGGTWNKEDAWSGSGGGISGIWNLATYALYQSFVPSPGSGGSSTYRNVPDVCLNASSGYSIYHTSGYPTLSGSWSGSVGGTSCASPLWAGYTARVNQYRAGLGLGSVGFLNPTLYYVAQSTRYASDFHDIISGNNNTYPAVAGYDNVTGWGSFNGGNLFHDLLDNAAVFYVDGDFHGSPENGTITNPYKTVTAAVAAASSTEPTLIYIKGNSYLENLSINKKILFINNGGCAATIGN